MNKRITELMIEAGKTIPGDKHIDADFCEKFAELIVRECIDTILDSSVEYATRPQIANEIKEHFGVES
jgi:hypothetical protein